MTHPVRTWCFLLLLLPPTAAGAQDGGLPSWVSQDPFTRAEDDPIGIDPNDQLERVAPTLADEELQERVPIVRGEALSAIAGVRETDHAVNVTLSHGLAIVETSMRFTSNARYAAEVRYRLAVPEGASLASLEVCNARGCRPAAVDASTGVLSPYDDAVRSHGGVLPVGHAASVRDERGSAILVRAAPVAREGRGSGPLTVRVRYAVPAPLRGGRVRISLPERGRDNRIAAARIRVRSDEVSGGSVDGVDAVEREVERPAWLPAEITGRLAAGAAVSVEAWRMRCGVTQCARLRAVAAAAPARARDVILLLDASPSTNGPARGRLSSSVGALLTSLPSGSRVSIAVFAARAEAVIQEPSDPQSVTLVEISRALERPLGSATRFEAAWELVSPWTRRARDPLLIVIGDGGLTTGEPARRAFAAVRASRVALASLNVADRPSSDGLREGVESAFGLVIDAGAEADRAARGHGMDALEERMAPMLAPIVAAHVRAGVGRRTIDLGALRAGEELVWEGAATNASIAAGRTARASSAPRELEIAIWDRFERSAGRRGLRLAALAPESMNATVACGVRPSSASAPVGRDTALVLAEARRCTTATDAQPAPVASAPRSGRIAQLEQREGQSSLPARSLLDMLRRRIVPVARGCFRDDRHGRGNYHARAVFEFRLADREVVAADVTGRIDAELRTCLLRAIDTLEVPRFDGTVQVRYPIHTAATPTPPTLTLDADVAEAVDAVAGDGS